MVIKSYKEKSSWKAGRRGVAINSIKQSEFKDSLIIYEWRPEGVREQTHHVGI